MASNNAVVFFIYDGVTGDPLTGATPTFDSLNEVSDNSDQTGSAPAITEIGSTGMYKFTRPAGTYHWVGNIDCGASALSRYQPIDIRSEDKLDAVNLIGTPVGASLSADIAGVPDTVWDEAISGHLTSGTTGKYLSDTYTGLLRALGMLHENSVLDNTTFDVNGNMTDGRLRIYDSKANALSAGMTGLVATYTISASYTGTQLDDYTMVKE